MATRTTYNHGNDAATLRSHSSRTAEAQADYLLPYIKPKAHILDVGCGPGTITCGLANYAPEGKITGIDSSLEVIEKAKSEAKDVSNVTFQVGQAHSLPFEDETFDIVHCHAVLVHIPDPAAAVKEMRRVCKTGGDIAAREPDLDTCVMHPHYPALEKWKVVQGQMKRNEGAEPNAGRHLAAWATAAGCAIEDIQGSSNTLQYFGGGRGGAIGKCKRSDRYVETIESHLRNRLTCI